MTSEGPATLCPSTSPHFCTYVCVPMNKCLRKCLHVGELKDVGLSAQLEAFFGVLDVFFYLRMSVCSVNLLAAPDSRVASVAVFCPVFHHCPISCSRSLPAHRSCFLFSSLLKNINVINLEQMPSQKNLLTGKQNIVHGNIPLYSYKTKTFTHLTLHLTHSYQSVSQTDTFAHGE